MISKKQLTGFLVLLGMALIAYFKVTSAGFIWDDDSHLLNCLPVRSLSGLFDIWFHPGATIQYFPLTFTTFLFEHKLWGFHPLGYHLVNVALHVVNALLVWRVLRRLEVPGAWWVAAIFALHPVQVESVAWISERKNVLSGFFFFSSLWMYVKFLDSGARVNYWSSFLLFVIALTAKSPTVVMPLVVLVLIWWKRGRIKKGDILSLAPFLLIGGIFSCFVILVENKIVGAGTVFGNLTWLDRCLIAGRIFWFYLGKLVWPHPIIFSYPKWIIDATSIRAYVYPLTAVGLFGFLWKSKSILGRGPLAAMAVYVVTILPALGFFNVYGMRFSYVADHFQYLANLGPIALLVALGTQGAERLHFSNRRPAVLAGILVLTVLSVLTSRQVSVYSNRESVWLDTLRKNPGSSIANADLGFIYLRRGQIQEALSLFEQSSRTDPGYESAQIGQGLALLELGRLNDAQEHLEEAIRLEPAYPHAYALLADTYYRQGHYSAAVDFARKSLSIEPNFPIAVRVLNQALPKAAKK